MPVAKTTAGAIEVPDLKLEEMTIRIIGDSPLIVHCFSEKARKAILNTHEGKAKAGREKKVPHDDYLASMYYTTDGKPGLPAIMFKAAAVNAANDANIAKVLARRAFHVVGPEILPLIGTPHMREDVVRIGMGTTDIRHRAEFTEWAVDVHVVYNAGIISGSQLVNLFKTAGFGVGVGEWRPERDGTFGMFHVASADEIAAMGGMGA